MRRRGASGSTRAPHSTRASLARSPTRRSRHGSEPWATPTSGRYPRARMARGAAKQRPRQAKAQPTPRAARKPPVAEQTMFFMRLRRSTKPVFIFLALVFALSFVFLGVGSGSSGIGDLLRGNFNFFGGGSSGTSVSKAQKRIDKNPRDA